MIPPSSLYFCLLSHYEIQPWNVKWLHQINGVPRIALYFSLLSHYEIQLWNVKWLHQRNDTSLFFVFLSAQSLGIQPWNVKWLHQINDVPPTSLFFSLHEINDTPPTSLYFSLLSHYEIQPWNVKWLHQINDIPPTSLYFALHVINDTRPTLLYIFLLSHYEIQPEGPVQQITYVTEKDSALLRLIKEEDARRSAHDTYLFACLCCMFSSLLLFLSVFSLWKGGREIVGDVRHLCQQGNEFDEHFLLSLSAFYFLSGCFS